MYYTQRFRLEKREEIKEIINFNKSLFGENNLLISESEKFLEYKTIFNKKMNAKTNPIFWMNWGLWFTLYAYVMIYVKDDLLAGALGMVSYIFFGFMNAMMTGLFGTMTFTIFKDSIYSSLNKKEQASTELEKSLLNKLVNNPNILNEFLIKGLTETDLTEIVNKLANNESKDIFDDVLELFQKIKEQEETKESNFTKIMKSINNKKQEKNKESSKEKIINAI
jgi:hypothetical protein